MTVTNIVNANFLRIKRFSFENPWVSAAWERARLHQVIFDRRKARWKRRVPRPDFHSFKASS